MKNKLIILLVFIIPLATFFILQNVANNNSAIANNTMQQEAMMKGKLLKFSSPMCSECKKVKEAVDKVFGDYKEAVLLEEINVSENSDKTNGMIETYKITVVPTIVFLDKNGAVVNKIEGLADEITIKENLDKIK